MTSSCSNNAPLRPAGKSISGTRTIQLARAIPLIGATALLISSLIGCANQPDKQQTVKPVSTASSEALTGVYEKMDALLTRAAPPEILPEDMASLALWQAEQRWWENVPEEANLLVTECLQLPGCDQGRLAGFQSDLMSRQNEMMMIHQDLLEAVRSDIVSEAEPEDVAAGVEVMPQLAGNEPMTDTQLEGIRQTEQLLNGTNFTQLITVNDRVKAALDDWLTWGRPNLLLAYENYQYLRPLIAPVYEQAGFPEALLFAMIATESTGKAHAKSRAGAAGILQFMRFTGARYGLSVVDGFDQRYDPVMATQANALYLNEHLKIFHNSLEKTLAAYNGGENRMIGLQRRNQGKSVWDKKIYYALPKETRDYVPKVLAAAWLFMHPEDYRLEFPKVDNTLAELTVARDTSMSELGVCLGQNGAPTGWFRTLRNLNPTYKPQDVIEQGDRLHIPQGLKAIYESHCNQTDEAFLQLAKEMHRANYPDGAKMAFYVVRKGDTANRIAARFDCVSTRELTAINNIRPPRYTVRVGQVLQVPEC